MAEALTAFSRSEIAESIHKVKILITESNGKILYSTNNDHDLIYPRSAIKIFQEFPLYNLKLLILINLIQK